jgi:hypothetical protein
MGSMWRIVDSPGGISGKLAGYCDWAQTTDSKMIDLLSSQPVFLGVAALAISLA